MRLVEHEAVAGPPTFEVVFICTANRARSPFAAGLMRRHLAGLPLAVESFGTMEEGGAPALPAAVRAAREFGIDLTRHRARPLPAGGLGGSTLAIGFEPYHVAAAVVEGRAERSRAFLLTELAEAMQSPGMAGRTSVLGLDALVGLADAQRREREQLAKSIADPVGMADRRVIEIFGDIDRLLDAIATHLVGAFIQRLA